MFHIGIDIGSTFTDCVLVGADADGQVTAYRTAKTLSTSLAFARASSRRTWRPLATSGRCPSFTLLAPAATRAATGEAQNGSKAPGPIGTVADSTPGFSAPAHTRC